MRWLRRSSGWRRRCGTNAGAERVQRTAGRAVRRGARMTPCCATRRKAVSEMKDDTKPMHQRLLPPADNKFHVGNGEDGKHYWLTPPELLNQLAAAYGPFD